MKEIVPGREVVELTVSDVTAMGILGGTIQALEHWGGEQVTVTSPSRDGGPIRVSATTSNRTYVVTIETIEH